jgi:aerobic-type carbon monoxide dehydrogenase small subunit (CoxS/CutS family)
MDETVPISVTVNGVTVDRRVEPRQTLVDFLRYGLELTGSHVGCEQGVCGACTVRVDGAIVRGCLMLAVQCDGSRVETIEGVAGSGAAGTGEVFDLQQAFAQENALQCGFCTPGMLMTARGLLDENPNPTEHEIRTAISGGICRCTGYKNIVAAIQWAAEQPAGERQEV